MFEEERYYSDLELKVTQGDGLVIEEVDKKISAIHSRDLGFERWRGKED